MAEDGEGPGEPAHRAGLAGQALGDGGGDDAFAGGLEPVHSRGVGADPGLAQPGQEAVQQLGVAAGDVRAAGDEPLVGARAQGAGDELGGGAGAEGAEFDEGQAVLGEHLGEDARAGAVAVGALRQEDEQGPGGSPAQDEVEASQGGFVAPLGVVEHERQGIFGHEFHGLSVDPAVGGVGVVGALGGEAVRGSGGGRRRRPEEGVHSTAVAKSLATGASGVVTDSEPGGAQAVGDGAQEGGPADAGGASYEDGPGGSLAGPHGQPYQAAQLDGTAGRAPGTALTCIEGDRHGVPLS